MYFLLLFEENEYYGSFLIYVGIILWLLKQILLLGVDLGNYLWFGKELFRLQIKMFS